MAPSGISVRREPISCRLMLPLRSREAVHLTRKNPAAVQSIARKENEN